LPEVAAVIVGAPGNVNGVLETSLEAGELPAVFTAPTVK
jgi:hypothetical protein